MATTKHRIAIFQEGFILVAIDYDDVQNYGERTICDAIQEHPWIVEQEIPVVIVYQTDDGEIRAFGPSELVDAISEMNFDDIEWGHELTLQWE